MISSQQYVHVIYVMSRPRSSVCCTYNARFQASAMSHSVHPVVDVTSRWVLPDRDRIDTAQVSRVIERGYGSGNVRSRDVGHHIGGVLPPRPPMMVEDRLVGYLPGAVNDENPHVWDVIDVTRGATRLKFHASGNVG